MTVLQSTSADVRGAIQRISDARALMRLANNGNPAPAYRLKRRITDSLKANRQTRLKMRHRHLVLARRLRDRTLLAGFDALEARSREIERIIRETGNDDLKSYFDDARGARTVSIDSLSPDAIVDDATGFLMSEPIGSIYRQSPHGRKMRIQRIAVSCDVLSKTVTYAPYGDVLGDPTARDWHPVLVRKSHRTPSRIDSIRLYGYEASVNAEHFRTYPNLVRALTVDAIKAERLGDTPALSAMALRMAGTQDAADKRSRRTSANLQRQRLAGLANLIKAQEARKAKAAADASHLEAVRIRTMAISETPEQARERNR